MRKKTLFILALFVTVLMTVAAIYAQSTRAKTGIGRVRPGQMTKGARVVPMMWQVPQAPEGGTASKGWKVLDDTAAAGRLKFPLPMFPVTGYVANFYMLFGTRSDADSFLNADTSATKAYRIRITKNTSTALLGQRRTSSLANKPRTGVWWFITGTDTTSKFNVLTTDTLFAIFDTCGGAPDSLPRNIWVKYEWYPADAQ